MANLKCVQCSKDFEHNARGRRPAKCPDCRGEKRPEPSTLADVAAGILGREPKESDWEKTVRASVMALPVAKTEATSPIPPVVLKTPDGEPKSEFFKRMEARKEEIRAKYAAQKAAFGDPKPLPFDKATILSDTIVEGKTVAEWADLYDNYKGDDATQDFPGFVCNAIYYWKLRGRPTPKQEKNERKAALLAKAEEIQKFAELDFSRAAALEELGKTDKAAKLRDQAAKKKEKARTLFEEAA